MAVAYKQALRRQDLEETVEKACIGLMKCPDPKCCCSYLKCLQEYISAEMRNEILALE
jgi:hypothetical protein